MTVRRAMKEAWALYRAHPGDMLLFMLLQVAVRLIALCPLLCLADASLCCSACPFGCCWCSRRVSGRQLSCRPPSGAGGSSPSGC